ncbi:CYTOCHROME P450 SUPERFAMILY PROTEIN [Salix koriyanagi]|uniref:CYTOCHROME P450 SUPERFAMILY PROTEIN n=1 Tax=Salix koriyanagi TaxID=2511006 RepID=A0A9Q0UXR8_9ROSI|nr:CYTOCHROME P450 SUPERFAMILY PROTEIN [Salix koriyanagi]
MSEIRRRPDINVPGGFTDDRVVKNLPTDLCRVDLAGDFCCLSSSSCRPCYSFAEKKKEKTRYRLPPGRRGWPLIGDSFSWYNAVAGSHPPQFVQQQVNRFGKIFSCSLFGKWAVVSADPTFNRFIMQNEGKLFQSSYPKSFRDLVGKNGVITVQGEQQRKLHGIASNMMRLEKLKFHFLDDIQLVMLQTLNKFDSNQVILLQDVCRMVAINLMVNQLLGASTETEIKEMAHLFSDFVDGCLSLPVNLPGFAYHTAMKARERIIRKINKTIEKRRREGSSEGGNGVLGRLLEEENLPDNEVADFIINLLFAGSETTAKTMLFAVYFLTQCPVAMQQLQDEQDSLRGDCNGVGMLAWQDYKAMSFTMCLFTWMKICTRKPPPSIHGDGWTLQIKKREIGEVARFYCPFGGGARFCPGAELSRLQISLFLHYFVTTYTWSQLKEDRMSFFPSARLVNGFQIRLTKRRHVTDSTLPSPN